MTSLPHDSQVSGEYGYRRSLYLVDFPAGNPLKFRSNAKGQTSLARNVR